MTQQFTTTEEVFQWMDGVCTRAIQPGLERMEWLLERLDYPEKRCKFIHIAGTNGKGSTAAMIASILQQAGYKTGLFVSPAVVHWSERIQVNGKYISECSFVRWVNHLRPLVEEMEAKGMGSPSPFELYTIIAICYFAYEKYPWFIVWETGLGGALDSTNVVFPLVSVITRIGVDHQGWLGSSVQEIASQKAGIIKSGVPVVCSQQVDVVKTVIEEKAISSKSAFYVQGRDFSVTPLHHDLGGQNFIFSSVYRTLPSLQIPLMGAHQLQNAATALMTLEVLQHHYATVIEAGHIEQGLKKVTWPGRIEKVSERPIILFDGAHNEDGMKVLVETLKHNFSYNRLFVMIGMMRDKDAEQMLSLLLPLADKIIATQLIEEQRSYSAEELADIVKQQSEDREVIPMQLSDKGFDQLKEWADEDDLILITGSLYLVSEVRTYFFGSKLI